MQFAKDSFFLALQQRLAGLNPARTVTVNGATVPAVVVVENLPPSSAEPQPNAFYIEWGAADVVGGHAGNAALMSLDCVISYYTLGTVQSMVDRGRLLGQLDDELLGICQPPNTEKLDYTQSPSADLGTSVFWGQPSFTGGDTSGVGRQHGWRIRGGRCDGRCMKQAYQDGRVERKARLTIFFFSEVTLVMSTSPLRAAMVPVTRQMRAYFAPVNRTTETPTIFDPGVSGAVSRWIRRRRRGWIWDGSRTSSAGMTRRRMSCDRERGLCRRCSFADRIEARVEFDFREWGKLQMALAGGSEHMNVLAPAPERDASAFGRNTSAGSRGASGIDCEPN